MIKTLSIKSFIIIAIFAIIVGGMITFTNFYNSTRSNISELLKNSIQNNTLDIKYFLDKNLHSNNIDNLSAYLDSIAFTNRMIKDIHVVDNNSKIIYSSDRDYKKKHTSCMPISEINEVDIFQTQCYAIHIKMYHELTPYYFTSNIYINNKYLNTILYKNVIDVFTHFIILITLLLIVLWLIFKQTVINPLEKLHTFADHTQEPPNQFFIEEIESIRNSLAITFKKLQKEQDQLYKLSTKDQLSGLYNRMSLTKKIEWLIKTKSRKKEKFAVIFLDLDNFKTINDTKGHEFGDKVLQKISEILLKSVRGNDIVARLGGDEFVVVLSEHMENELSIIEVLSRIKKHLSEHITIDTNDKEIITASMGVSIYPRDGEDVNTLLKNADLAMYKSKEIGKNDYNFFTTSLDEIIHEKVEIQNLMVKALENNYFQLYYQPKVDITQNKITASEALIRLIDPEKGLIPPDKFISIAEQNNFIIEIGEWVIKESVKQIQLWQNTKYKDIKISINVSAKQFQDKNFIKKLDQYTQNIPKNLLDIELTESVFVNNFDEQHRAIEEIKALGFSISLDDFGTGYSSLSYLKSIPFDTIKIDKSFIDDIEKETDEKFVSMIINIAQTLHLEVVAEGVETEQQLDILKTMQCTIYQGYLCSKPLPTKEFENLIDTKCL
jgi:diguanylate cyclase (GGDEF)-like protein